MGTHALQPLRNVHLVLYARAIFVIGLGFVVLGMLSVVFGHQTRIFGPFEISIGVIFSFVSIVLSKRSVRGGPVNPAAHDRSRDA